MPKPRRRTTTAAALLSSVVCLATYGCGGSSGIDDPFSVTCAQLENDPGFDGKLADALLDRVHVAGNKDAAAGQLTAAVNIACVRNPDEPPGRIAVDEYRQEHPG